MYHEGESRDVFRPWSNHKFSDTHGSISSSLKIKKYIKYFKKEAAQIVLTEMRKTSIKYLMRKVVNGLLRFILPLASFRYWVERHKSAIKCDLKEDSSNTKSRSQCGKQI